jgi:hypothetical protein
MSRISKSFSFWAFVAFISLFALQLSPFPGFYLMLFGGAMWCGLAVHAMLLGLVVEASLARVPRVLIIVPLAAYGGYYFMYLKQGREIALKAEQMQTTNPSFVRKFDPSMNSLVVPYGRAEFLASHYDIPVTYVANRLVKPEGYLSHRLLDADQCGRVRKAQATLREQKAVLAFNLISQVQFEETGSTSSLDNVCVLNFPEAPALAPLVVTQRGDYDPSERKRGIMEQFTDFSLAGKVFATYETAAVWRLPKLPFLAIGCFLNDMKSSWDCGADFARSYRDIDGTPKNVDEVSFDSPESIVLGLRKLSRSDYTTFKAEGTASNVVDHIEDYPAQQKRSEAEESARLFAQFTAFVRDRDVESYKSQIVPPPEMQAAVLEKPERLIPLSDDLVARFIQLMQAEISIDNQWLQLLDKSLAALPNDTYVAMSDDKIRELLGLLEKKLPYPFCATGSSSSQSKSYTTIAELLKLPASARVLWVDCFHLGIQLL